MEKLIVLGTGSGITINCYSLSALLENNKGDYLLIDTGSGNQILNHLKAKNININKIHDIFISHKHIDHLWGIIPLLRYIMQQHKKNNYDGILNIYCAEEIKQIVDMFIEATFHKEHENLYKEIVKYYFCENGKKFNIIGYEVEIIDTESIECTQYGFKTILNSGKTLAFLGDVPCSKNVYSRIEKSDWVLHEAMCLDEEKDKIKPHEKNHSTVKDVAIVMNNLNIKNLLLWHCVDNNIEMRKELFTKEAKEYFYGNIYVPDDLDEIEL
jgi:ribonuclease Z